MASRRAAPARDPMRGRGIWQPRAKSAVSALPTCGCQCRRGDAVWQCNAFTTTHFQASRRPAEILPRKALARQAWPGRGWNGLTLEGKRCAERGWRLCRGSGLFQPGTAGRPRTLPGRNFRSGLPPPRGRLGRRTGRCDGAPKSPGTGLQSGTRAIVPGLQQEAASGPQSS